jgi:hypothetical protein
MSWIKMPTTRNTCPGIRDFLRPTVRYVKCHVCGGDVEIWSDESEGVCITCGSLWTQPDENASCLDYCEYAEQCKHIIENQRTE